MKVLIAADGTSWESVVARRFEKAVWYLVIDSETKELEVYQNVFPHNHCNILLLASRLRVPVIVAGGMDTATARLMLSLNFRFGVATRITVRQTLEVMTTGLLQITDVSRFRKGLPIGGTARRGTPSPRAKRPTAGGMPVVTGATSHVHHHLQQYGGRGH